MQSTFSRKLTTLLAVGLAFLTVSIDPSPSSAAALQCQHLPQLFEGYFRSHYAIRSMTDDVRAHTIEQYVRFLDPSKTMFVEEDVVKIKKDLPQVFNTMRLGDCSVLEIISKLRLTRAKENEDFVRGFLGKDYKLDETVEVTVDPEKRGFPKSVDEKKDTLRKMVHFQISNLLVTKVKLAEAKKQVIHRYELITKRLKKDKPAERLIGLAEAFALALDPHSSFLSQDAMEDFQIQMQLSLEGIGASLSSQDGFTVIEETIPGGGAEKSKMLHPKDKIIAVARESEKPVSVIDMDLQDVVKMIRGPKGTKVTLTILRQAEKTETFDVTIVRDKIDIKAQAAKIAYVNRKVGSKNYKIGVIDLPSFYGGGEEGGRSSYDDLKALLVEAKQNKVDGIVLDLSRNGGGLLDHAVKISGLFIRKGGIVATKGTDQKVEILPDEDEDTVYSGPLVILTSRLSASASEILAGAMKDYRRAVVVGGDHTFGKGTVQALSPLPLKLGAMKVTTGMFFLPGGESTQHKGVAADIQLPSLFNNDDVGEKTMDYSLPPQSIAPFLSKEALSRDAGKRWEPVKDGWLRKLVEKSKQRVAKDPKFAEIRKNIEEMAKNKGTVKLADLRKKSEAEDKDEKKKKEADASSRFKGIDLDSPFLNEGVNILSDLIAVAS